MALPAIPLIASAIVGGMISAACTMVGKALIGLGVGFITYTGVKTGLNLMQTQLNSYLMALPAFVLQGAGMLQVDTIFSMLFSAFLARMTLNGLQSDTIKKFAVRPS